MGLSAYPLGSGPKNRRQYKAFYELEAMGKIYCHMSPDDDSHLVKIEVRN